MSASRGTGSSGAELARQLARSDIEVVEVDRPNRQMRRRAGKSDPVDAVAAARAALGGVATGRAKSRDGNVEAIRVLMVARRSAVSERIAIINQLRHLCFTADDVTRRQFQEMTPARMIKTAAAMRPRRTDDVRYATHFALRALGRRARHLQEEVDELNKLMHPLIDRTAPGLLGLYGVGYDVAAKLLIAAGDNPQRLRSEAAWANLCGVAPLEASRARSSATGSTGAETVRPTPPCTASSSPAWAAAPAPRPTSPADGLRAKPTGEIARILKRYVARQAFKHLPHPR